MSQVRTPLSCNCESCAESVDIWFHRYENGRDIEGRCQLLPTCMIVKEILLSSAVDYNSWIESETGRKLADSLDKDVVLAEGLDWTVPFIMRACC